jgi:hypothetical protein
MGATRRGFLGLMLAAAAAPVVFSGGIERGLLMPVRRIVEPGTFRLWADGIHDDTRALQAIVDGKRVLLPDGSPFLGTLPIGAMLVTNTITMPKRGTALRNGHLRWGGGDEGVMINVPAGRASRVAENLYITRAQCAVTVGAA